MNKLVNVINKISTAGGIVAAGLLCVTVLLILLEIILRTGFGTSTLLAEEVSAYFLVGLIFLSLAYVLKTDGHIRIKMITSRLAKRKQILLDLICAVIALIFFAYLSFYAGELFYRSLILGSRAPTIIRTPLFIPQFFLFAGCALMTLQFVAHIITNVNSLKSFPEDKKKPRRNCSLKGESTNGNYLDFSHRHRHTLSLIR